MPTFKMNNGRAIMATVTEMLNQRRTLIEEASKAEALSLDGLASTLREEASKLFEQAQRSSVWLWSGWPIAPERESEWFANHFGLSTYSLDSIEIPEIVSDWSSMGKFDSQFCEIVWSWSLGEAPFHSEEHSGESATLVRLGTLDLLSVFGLLCEEFPSGNLPSAAIVWTDSRGFVYCDLFDSIEEAEAEEQAILSRVESAADEACESGACLPCSLDEACEAPYSCEHSGHARFDCERSEWLPSLEA